MTLRLAHIAVIGALSAAFALAGCGRKGPLDPPPGAAAAEPPRAASPASLNPLGDRSTPRSPAAFDSQGRPIAPSNAPKKRLPMDWLID